MSASILVVEDEEPIQILLSYNLESEGYRVRHTAEGEEVVQLVSDERPDLIVLDWMLPGISGIEVCRLLRAKPETRDIPVIMLTSPADHGVMTQLAALGISGHVMKPFTPAALIEKIGGVLALPPAPAVTAKPAYPREAGSDGAAVSHRRQPAALGA